MTFQSTPKSDPAVRPDRIRFLAEMPLEAFNALNSALSAHPNWDRYFIMNNPVAWPDGMSDAIARHTGVNA